jgi:5-hmdU DNA kinase-like protein
VEQRRVRDLFKFLNERHQIYLRRERGDPKPWTKNVILRDYRFTQNYRELDKTTIWIAKNWRNPHKHEPYTWFAMAVARYINWPPTLEAIGYPVPWHRERVIRIMDDIRTGNGAKHLLKVRAATLELFPSVSQQVFGRSYKIDAGQSRQIFGGAYFLNSIGPKIQSVVNDRLHLLWVERKATTKRLEACKSLAELYEVVQGFYGFGSFMAAQLIADIKYLPQWDEKKMPDWWTWAVSGPGSRLGMNYMLNLPIGRRRRSTAESSSGEEWNLVPKKSFPEKTWLAHLLELEKKINLMLERENMPRAHMQDVQGFLCEFSKYEKCRLGHGRPKQKFNGRKEDGNRIK